MADSEVRNLDNPFGEVYEALDLNAQRKALRGAMRKEANALKKSAQENLGTASGGKNGSVIGQGTAQKLGKGIYARVFPKRYGAGFMVSVRPHGNRGIHTNRQGLKKPVLMWAEDGTRSRNVGKRNGSTFGRNRYTGKRTRMYSRMGHSTGKMGAYRFLEKTERENTDGIESRLFENFQRNVEKAAAKL